VSGLVAFCPHLQKDWSELMGECSASGTFTKSIWAIVNESLKRNGEINPLASGKDDKKCGPRAHDREVPRIAKSGAELQDAWVYE